MRVIFLPMPLRSKLRGKSALFFERETLQKGSLPAPGFLRNFGVRQRAEEGVFSVENMFTFFDVNMLFQRQKSVFLAVLIKKNE